MRPEMPSAQRAGVLSVYRRVMLSPVMARTSIYGDRDPADVAAYSLNEAAALVGVPRGTLRSWVWGRSFTTKAGARRRSPAIITTPDARFLSFTNVVEAHVIAALRKEHKIKLYKASPADVARMRKEMEPYWDEWAKQGGPKLVEALAAVKKALGR